MKKILVITLFMSFSMFKVFAQEKNTQSVWRLNFLNPGVEYETPTGNNSTISFGAGIGYSGSYPHSSASDVNTGLVYAINPFIDVQHKWFYNFDKRKTKGLNITNNSANFVSARMLARGKTLFGDDTVTENLDFAVGPTWGIQRKYGKSFHLLFDMGPIYYFDVDGGHGFFPFVFQLNLGFDL